jgi:N6-adenosine-specific RNA methylase IME4
LLDIRNLGQYDIILADPPWSYDKTAFNDEYAREISFEMPYSTMTDDEIKAMKIPAARSSMLFLWAIVPKLDVAIEVMKQWGYEYKSMIVWDKMDYSGLGFYVRNGHEDLLIGKKGGFKCPAPGDRPYSVFRYKVRKHSQKPDGIYTMIEEMYPGASKVELFARRRREGWTAWGNQLDTQIQTTLLKEKAIV